MHYHLNKEEQICHLERVQWKCWHVYERARCKWTKMMLTNRLKLHKTVGNPPILYNSSLLKFPDQILQVFGYETCVRTLIRMWIVNKDLLKISGFWQPFKASINKSSNQHFARCIRLIIKMATCKTTGGNWMGHLSKVIKILVINLTFSHGKPGLETLGNVKMWGERGQRNLAHFHGDSVTLKFFKPIYFYESKLIIFSALIMSKNSTIDSGAIHKKFSGCKHM